MSLSLIVLLLLHVNSGPQSASISAKVEDAPALQVVSNNLKFRSRVTGFEAVSSLRDGSFVQLTLRNNYAKTITAISFRLGRSMRVSTDLAETGRYTKPGEEFILRQVVEPDTELMLAAIVFEDGTFEGDQRFAVDLQQRRAGSAAQYRRIQKIIKRAVDDAEPLDTLRQKIEALSENPTGRSEQYRVGLHNVKQVVLSDIGVAQRDGDNIGSALTIGSTLNSLVDRWSSRHLRLDAFARQQVK